MYKGIAVVLILLMAGVLYSVLHGYGEGTGQTAKQDGAETVIYSGTAGKPKSASVTSPPLAETIDETVWIYVHVCGAVQSPGVYELPETARVCDAVFMAGGITADGDTDYINQAATLTDGERVYIPYREELAQLTEEEYLAGQKAGTASVKVNINTADAEELMTLNGIGEARAKSIISFREAKGPFSSIEEIMNISGIKAAAFERIKDNICTGYEG